MTPGQALVAALITLMAFVVRCLPVDDVFVKGRVLFIEPDSYYHMRRILFAMRNFPESLGFDPYLGFPTHAKGIWPPFLDSAFALALLPFASPTDPHGVESILVWIPPAAGALAVLATFVLAFRLFGFSAAASSSLILCFLSAHFWYSQISFVDHHAFVALLSTLLLSGGVTCLSRAGDSSWTRGRAIVSGAALGTLSGITLLIWPGGILYVALVAGAMLIFATHESRGPDRESLLTALVTLHLVGLCVILPFSAFNEWPQWSPFSPLVLSRFQPLFFGLGALHGLACLLLFRREVAQRGFGRRCVEMLVSGGGLLLVSVLIFPDFASSYGDAAAWLGRTDSFQAMVGESRPLFDLHGVFTRTVAELRLSYFLYLLPFATLVMAWAARRRDDATAVIFLAGWTLILLAFTLLQKRFFNSSGIALSLVFGWSTVALARWISGVLAHGAVGKAIGATTATLVTIVLLWPTFAAYHGPLVSIRSRLAGKPSIHNERIREQLARYNMAEWVRSNTPATSGLWDAEATPEYGVLARWGDGHLIKYVAERPTLVGNFGDDLGSEHFLKARGVYGARPAVAARVLEDLNVRYIVIRTRAEKRPLAKWLIAGSGSGSGRYRLVFEAPDFTGNEKPAYAVFEFVPGAEVVGSAPAGARIEARLGIATNLRRRALYQTSTVADDEGIYRLRLAYANRGEPPATRPDAAYELRAGDQVAGVIVDESQVRRGVMIRGPSF